MATPQKGVAYQLYTTLVSEADQSMFQVAPTLATGDFKVSKDGGAFVDLATLPTVAPAGSRMVQIDLSASEMGADKVVIQAIDATGAEWQEMVIFLDVPVTNIESIPSAVWDEPLNAHNTGGTSGKALRQIKEGTVSAESDVNNDITPTATVFTTDLTEAVDDFYLDVSIVFVGGALTGQSRTIVAYDGATKAITLDEGLTSAPADGDTFIIKTDHVHPIEQIAKGVWGPPTGDVVAANVATLLAIDLGDRIETNLRLIVNEAGTATALIDKEITGSLLTPNVTIRTTDTTP